MKEPTQTMNRREFLKTLAVGTPSLWATRELAAASATEAQPKPQGAAKQAAPEAPPEAPPPPPESILLTPTTTLFDVLQTIAPFTPARIELSDPVRKMAKAYTFPPYLHGHELSCKPAAEALNFLTGLGWEGSSLPVEDRAEAGANFQLARTPFAHWVAGEKRWVCNNRCWDWRWEKTANGQEGPDDGGRILLVPRLQPDGDVVERQPFRLGRVEDDYVLDTLLDMIKQKIGILVNVEGPRYVPVPVDGKTTRLMPMTVADVKAAIGDLFDRPHTLGGYLHLLALGLNHHSASVKGDWKWSSKEQTIQVDGGQKTVLIYTLRDYAHWRQ